MNVEKLLHEAVHDYDAVEPAEGWLAIRRKIAGRRRRRRVVGGALVVGAVAAAVGIALGPVGVLDDEAEKVRVGEDSVPREGWRRIADPPESLTGRQYLSTVWTGEEVLVWGGARFTGAETLQPFVDGMAWNPSTDTWRRIPEAPIAGRNGHSTVWTGEEMIVWGGFGLDGYGVADPPVFRDGAAYNPSTDTWRRIADNRFFATGHVAAWTGSVMVVTSGQQPEDGPGAAAYDPAADTWAVMAEIPIPSVIDAASAWTGEELIVWGGTYTGSGTGSPSGAALDPVAGTWRTLPDLPGPADPEADAAWNGQEVVVTGAGPEGSVAYDPESDTWRVLPRPEGTEPSGSAVVAGNRVVVWPEALVHEPGAREWSELPTPDFAAQLGAVVESTGEEVVVLGGEVSAAFRPGTGAGPATGGPAAPDCSAAGLPPDPEAQEGLPPTVAETRRLIAREAVECDFEGLAALTSEGFTASFGDPDDVARFWRDGEERGEEPLRTLRALLDGPFAQQEAQSALGGPYYVWPEAFADPESSYLGYRVGIAADGEWLFFVAGD